MGNTKLPPTSPALISVPLSLCPSSLLEPYPLSVHCENVSRPRRGCRGPWHFVRYRRVRRNFFTHKQVAIARAAASVDAPRGTILPLSRPLAPLPRGYREGRSVSLLSSPLAPLPRGCREGCSASLLPPPPLTTRLSRGVFCLSPLWPPRPLTTRVSRAGPRVSEPRSVQRPRAPSVRA